MMMKGKKERRMKARMTSTEDWWIPTSFLFSFYFLNFSSPWEQVAVISLPSPIPPVLSRPVLRSCFSTPWFSTYFWGNVLSKIQWEKNLHYSVLRSFLSFHVSNCGFNTTTVLCGKKEKPPSPFGSAGGWGVLGPCVVVHRILAFFLSLYIGLRDYTVSMWIQTVSIYQHVSVYFSCLIKRKKKKKRGV